MPPQNPADDTQHEQIFECKNGFSLTERYQASELSQIWAECVGGGKYTRVFTTVQAQKKSSKVKAVSPILSTRQLGEEGNLLLRTHERL